jgi:creatinine amidohydrolase
MTILARRTWAQLQGHHVETAVLPWGATEAHNTHLPYATDTIQCDAIGARAVAVAGDRGARVMLLPTVPFGVQTGQLDIPFCLNLNPSTQALVLRDLVRSLEPHGVRKFVVLNGHGGNDFKQTIRELQPATPILLLQVNWYQVLDARRYFDDPGDHAGELETSVMLEVAPELVGALGSAGPGTARLPAVAGMRAGWAWAPRRWTQVTDDTGVGNPALATRDKGARYLTALTETLAAFLVELDALDPSHAYR